MTAKLWVNSKSHSESVDFGEPGHVTVAGLPFYAADSGLPYPCRRVLVFRYLSGGVVLRSSFTITLALSAVWSAGCGSAPSGPKMVPVTGKVTFDGAPVEEGRITFRKTDGDQRAFAGEIKNGSYSVSTEAGRMAVVITASRLIPGKFDNSNGTPEPVGEMYIPPQYNEATSLVAEVKDGGSNDFPFDLTSKKGK